MKHLNVKELLENVASQCESNLVKWAVHPRVPEWWTAATFSLGENDYRIKFDRDYEMANVREGTIVRTVGIVLNHFSRENRSFECDELEDILGYVNELLDGYICPYYANLERAFLYDSFAIAFAKAGDEQRKAEMENEALKWKAWENEDHTNVSFHSGFHQLCLSSKKIRQLICFASHSIMMKV